MLRDPLKVWLSSKPTLKRIASKTHHCWLHLSRQPTFDSEASPGVESGISGHRLFRHPAGSGLGYTCAMVKTPLGHDPCHKIKGCFDHGAYGSVSSLPFWGPHTHNIVAPLFPCTSQRGLANFGKHPKLSSLLWSQRMNLLEELTRILQNFLSTLWYYSANLDTLAERMAMIDRARFGSFLNVTTCAAEARQARSNQPAQDRLAGRPASKQASRQAGRREMGGTSKQMHVNVGKHTTSNKAKSQARHDTKAQTHINTNGSQAIEPSRDTANKTQK